MRIRNFVLAVFGALLCLVSGALAQDNHPVERIFFDGKIFTAEPEHPYAEAVAIRGDKIVAVGNHVEVSSAVSKDAERVDLHGRTLLPGLIDSHIHAIHGGVSLNSADVGERVRSVPELVAFAAEAKKNGKGMCGDILLIRGIPLLIWSETNELNAQFSTVLTKNNPYSSKDRMVIRVGPIVPCSRAQELQRALSVISPRASGSIMVSDRNWNPTGSRWTPV